MNFKKKSMSVLIGVTALSAMLLTGCGSSNTATEQPSGEQTAEKITIVLSHNQPVDSPEDVGAQAMKAKIEELVGDQVSVELYPASQQGSLREQVEATQMGQINITMQPISVITPFVDDIKVIDFPYILPADREEIFRVLDSEVGDEALNQLEQGGFKGLGYWFCGYKLMTTKDIEIHTPADLVGVKMRVMESPLLLAQYQAWGANPIAIPYAELYNSLQQTLVDGQENPIQTIALNNYQEVQNNIIETYHGTMTYIMMANLDWFNGLPENIQEAIIEAEEFGRLASRQNYADQEAGYVEKVKNADGVNYYSLTEEEIAAFKEASLPVYESQAANEWQKQYVEKLQAAFAE